MTFVLALTGSIATGKSTVLQIFADMGIPTYSADQAVYELYEGEAVAPVAEKFPGVVRAGKIDRTKLADYLVAAPHRLVQLEAIVHPLVRIKTQEFLDRHIRQKTDVIVLEIPLYFENELPFPINAVAVTWCSEATQRDRALARTGMNLEKLNIILERQMPQAEKKARANFLIDTDASLMETHARVAQIVDECRSGKEM